MSDQNRSTVASLGCGTLIIIALIVLFLGRVDLEPLETEIAALRTSVETLQLEVEALRAEQARTGQAIDTIAATLRPPGG